MRFSSDGRRWTSPGLAQLTRGGPGKAWERQHDHALQITALNAARLHGIRSLADPRATTRRAANRPVPRLASHHYAGYAHRDAGAFYFY